MQNPLFFRENSGMLFGDAKQSVEEILSALSNGSRRDTASAARQATVTSH